ncbi:hepatocyte growth factor activator isoform X2 [Ambystoma mexicanum]|uniref:hepatocyte growth factor activator isoform X2 n=1 Tax=Ambystoma mexicanum TaxID=8296 RepID=UPI0037E818CD
MAALLLTALALLPACSAVSGLTNRMGFFGRGSTGMEMHRSEIGPGRTWFTVRTEDDKLCMFPFRHKGRVHYSCISNAFSRRPWCATTPNHDRDGEWGYCESVPEIVIQDHCSKNPCQNGGQCINAHDHSTYHCRCTDAFTGRNCETEKCFDFGLYEYFDIGESWPRIHGGDVEQCTCIYGQSECQRVPRYYACTNNPCPPRTACRMLPTGQPACACRGDLLGRYCNIDPNAKCYKSDEANDYRGTVRKTSSGQECLSWNSGLLYEELHMGAVENAIEKGLGSHPYCRSPDGDDAPWCYMLKDQHISWEHCNVSPCKEYARINNRDDATSNALFVQIPTCGKKHEKRVIVRGRIIGGTSALPAAHPWLAAIYIGENFCGGSLIHPCWVVSAAHCFSNSPKKSSVRVVLGQHLFNKSTEVTQTFEIDRYLLYDHFSIFSQTENDIALIKLKRQNNHCAKKTKFVQTICLPDNDIHFPPGHMCEIAGWGHLTEKAEEYSNHLQQAIVPILPDNQCCSPEVYGSEITENMFCAGYSDTRIDACQGDSGGPLACESEKVSYLYGIISWGDGCGLKPGVYTRVSNFVDWIYSKITPNKPPSLRSR